MSLIHQYEAATNPHYFGRGSVHFTAPLLPSGGVNTTAYGGRWGDNWSTAPARAGELRLPPGRRVGNASSMVITPAIQRLNTSAWDTRSNLIVSGVDISVVLHGLGADNLAAALHGKRVRTLGKRVTETLSVGRANFNAGSILFVRHLVDTNQPAVVTPNWTGWARDIDWRVSAFGIELLHGCACPPGASIDVQYWPEGSTETIEAMQSPYTELGVSFAGINHVDRKPVRVDAYRCRPQLDSGLQPLGDATTTVTLKLSLLPVRSAVNASAAWYRVLRGQHYMDM